MIHDGLDQLSGYPDEIMTPGIASSKTHNDLSGMICNMGAHQDQIGYDSPGPPAFYRPL